MMLNYRKSPNLRKTVEIFGLGKRTKDWHWQCEAKSPTQDFSRQDKAYLRCQQPRGDMGNTGIGHSGNLDPLVSVGIIDLGTIKRY
jgi:hypothetical protein